MLIDWGNGLKTVMCDPIETAVGWLHRIRDCWLGRPGAGDSGDCTLKMHLKYDAVA